MKYLRILLMVLVACASFHAAAQRQPVPVINYENVAIAGPAGQPLTQEQVKRAIQSAAAIHQWELTDQGPGRMLATLHVRGKHTVMVDVRYAADKFSLTYQDSTNMKYNPGPDGQGMIHPFYNRWAQDLKEAIRQSVAKG